MYDILDQFIDGADRVLFSVVFRFDWMDGRDVDSSAKSQWRAKV